MYGCSRSPSKRLLNRGPDHQQSVSYGATVLSSFVLHVQGTLKQPLSNGNLNLLHNGQLFGIPDSYTNDTKFLLDEVSRLGPLEAASHTSGPVAAILYKVRHD